MKKNITINLFGSLYAIDEDAYELLKNYLDNMRAYFSDKEDGSEIATDIESRVNELLSELKAGGLEAISIEHIENIIGRIGNPEQLEPESDAPAGNKKPEAAPADSTGGAEKKTPRRLYRNKEDCMIAGVLAGLCNYFGGTDPLPWRILAIILFFASATTLSIVYLVLWAIIPQAETAAERLQMRGQPINTQTLNEEIMRGVNGTKEFAGNVYRQSHNSGCLGILLKIVVAFFKIGLILFLIGCLIPLFVVLVPLLYRTLFGMTHPAFQFLDWLSGDTLWTSWTTLVSGIVFLGTVIFICIYWLLGSRQAGRPSKTTRRALGTICALSFIAMICSGVYTCVAGIHRERMAEMQENTRNGIFAEQHSWSVLDGYGLELKKLEGCKTDLAEYTNSLEDDSECYQVLKFRYDRSNRPMRFRVEKQLQTPAGTYRLEAVVKATGTGCYLFASPKGARTTWTDVTATNSTPLKNIDMPTAQKTELLKFATDSTALDKLHQWSSNWRYVSIDNIRHPGGKFTYGLSTEGPAGNDRYKSSSVTLYNLKLVRTDQ